MASRSQLVSFSLTLRTHIVYVSIVAALSASTIASAGQSGIRTFSTGPAVVDSTYSVFPQISTGINQAMRTSENEGAMALRPATPNGLFATSATNSTLPTISPKFGGIDFTGGVPPDPNMAAGPNHVVLVANTAVAFYTKAGVKQFQQDLSANGFFQGLGATGFTSDPKVIYDQVAKRWYVIILEIDFGGKQSKILMAVSDDTDPNGTWFKYRIEAKLTANNTEYWLDYPGMGYNKDAIAFTGNMFGFTSGYFGAQWLVIPKAPLLAGNPATVTSIPDSNSGTIQPCRTMDPLLDKIYAVSLESNSSLKVYAVQNPGTAPTVSQTILAVPAFVTNTGLAQSVAGQIDTLPDRVFGSCIRNGKIVTGHSVNVSNSDNRTMCRWYEIKVNSWPASGAPTLSQSGNVTAANGNYIVPALYSNKFGDISLLATACSPTVAADIVITTRKQTDPSGTMGAPTKLASSTGNPVPVQNRWGDYFQVCTDPVDDSTFWGVGQISKGGSIWQEQFFKWTVSTGGGGGGNPGIAPSAVSIYGGQGTLIAGNLSSVTSSNDIYYEVQALLNPSLGYVAAIEVTFNTNKVPSKVVSLNFTNEAITNTAVNATAMVWIYNWTTGTYVHKTSYTLPNFGNAQVQVPITSGFANYVSPTGQVKFVIRALTPLTGGAATRPYNLLEDFCKLEGDFLP